MFSYINLHHFWLVAKHGGYGSAADVAKKSPQTMSSAVTTLEKELDRKLVVRPKGKAKSLHDLNGNTSVALTSEGTTLAHEIGPGFEILQRAVEKIRRPSLTISALPSLDPCLEIMIERFTAVHPTVAIQVVVPKNPKALACDVRSGQVDVGLTEQDDSGVHAGLQEIYLWVESFVLVMPPSTEIPEGPVPLSSLGDAQFVTTPEYTSLRTHAEEGLGQAGVAMRIGHVTESRGGLVKAVVAGKGMFALLNPGLAALAKKLGAVVRPTAPPIPRTIVFLHRSDMSESARSFIERAQLDGPDGANCGW